MKSVFIHFLGASGTVTGSKYLVEYNDGSFLVDCGLFQGLKELRVLNWMRLPVDINRIKHVLLTHGHLDHVGYLPCLIQQGFDGTVYGTAPTLEIASIILRDSARIQEEEAEQATRGGYSRHKQPKPLYTLEEVEKCISRFEPVEPHQWLPIHSDIRASFIPNGHIIGSCYLDIEIQKKHFIFSGDVGRKNDVFLNDPEKPGHADYLFIESTYGNRLHPEEDAMQKLRQIIMQTVEHGGSVLIPSFAVERTQTLMYLLWKLKKNKLLPDLTFIMDSPMGADVLEIFRKFADWHKLDLRDCTDMCSQFRIVKEMNETFQIIHTPFPKIIIAGSGMITGGRILHYIQHYISKPEHTLLFVGYQAEGTRGRMILEGAHEIKIFGKYHPVKIKKEMLQGLSAHADQNGLLDWLSEIKNTPRKIYIVHGEKQSAEAFLVKLRDTFGWTGTVPSLYQIEELAME